MRALILAGALALSLAACTPPTQQAEAPAPVPEAPAAPPVPKAVEATAGSYVLEKTHASVTVTVPHMGLSNYTMRFASMDAVLDIDPANPTAAKLTASVDPASIRTDHPAAVYVATHKGSGFKSWDEDLSKSDKFFNSGKFPKISFVSQSVELTGADTAKITGELDMLGVKKPMVLDAKLNGAMASHPFVKTPALGFSATGTIKRSEWGMNYGIPNVGDDVTVRIEAEFIQAPKGGATEKKPT
jgi:polyisoprenoid-binding protein YceI